MGELTSYLEKCERLDNPVKKLNMLFAMKALDVEDHLLEKEDQVRMGQILDNMNLGAGLFQRQDGRREMSIEGALMVAEPYIEHAVKLESELEQSRKPHIPGKPDMRIPPDAVEQVSVSARMIRGANMLIQTYFPNDMVFASALQMADERGDFSIYRDLIKVEPDKRMLKSCYEADCASFEKSGIRAECVTFEEYEKQEKTKLYEQVLERSAERTASSSREGSRERISFQEMERREKKGIGVKDEIDHNHERARSFGDLGRAVLRGSGFQHPGKR